MLNTWELSVAHRSHTKQMACISHMTSIITYIYPSFTNLWLLSWWYNHYNWSGGFISYWFIQWYFCNCTGLHHQMEWWNLRFIWRRVWRWLFSLIWYCVVCFVVLVYMFCKEYPVFFPSDCMYSQGYAANLLTRDLHQQAVISFSFSFWHLEVGMGKMYWYIIKCVYQYFDTGVLHV